MTPKAVGNKRFQFPSLDFLVHIRMDTEGSVSSVALIIAAQGR